MDKQNYYAVLGVPKHANAIDIKKAYRKLAMQYHPDRNQNSKASEDVFKQIQAAFAVLSDPQKRKEYDRALLYGRVYNQSTYYAGAPTSSADTPSADEHSQQSTDESSEFSDAFTASTAYGAGFKKRSRKRKTSLPVILVLLLLLGFGVMQLWQHFGSLPTLLTLPTLPTPPTYTTHPALLDSAPHISLNTYISTSLGRSATEKVIPIEITDERVTQAMTDLYGTQRLQHSSKSCWLVNMRGGKGTKYCMSAQKAYVVSTQDSELLYLQTGGFWSMGEYAGIDVSMDYPANLGFAVFDLKNQEMLASQRFIPLAKGVSTPLARLELVQIACNGAFAWMGYAPMTQKGKLDAVLFATKGARFANIIGDMATIPSTLTLHNPANNKTLSWLQFRPANQQSCIYEAIIEASGQKTSNKPEDKKTYKAQFDLSQWRYQFYE